MQKKQMYINGNWDQALSGKWLNVYNPATLEAIAQVPDGGSEEARHAVAGAEDAFQSWKRTTAYERAGLLMRWYKLIQEHKEEIARTMTLEEGKPIAEARGEVDYASSFIAWFAEEGKRVYGETIPAALPDKRMFTIKQPVGVVAAITPWNFPAAMITRKAAPALAAGCTFIVKPAEDTPLTALMLAELAELAGFPPGVFNVITGSAEEIGKTLLADERVRKVTFTGSTHVGRLIMQQAASTIKKVSLELGGNAPAIVFEDADLEQAAEQIMQGKYRNSGETCIAINRIYAHESVAGKLANLIAEKSRALKVGNGLEEGVDIGPMINREGLEKIEAHMQDALDKGANIISGGNRVHIEGFGGYFFEPTVLMNLNEDMKMAKDETFGPVAPIAPFNNDEEAIRLANQTVYGLSAYLYTTNITRAITCAEQLEFGIVGLNDGVPSAAQAPFGGFKQSGLGREGGRQGIEEYLEVKYISLRL